MRVAVLPRCVAAGRRTARETDYVIKVDTPSRRLIPLHEGLPADLEPRNLPRLVDAKCTRLDQGRTGDRAGRFVAVAKLRSAPRPSCALAGPGFSLEDAGSTHHRRNFSVTIDGSGVRRRPTLATTGPARRELHSARSPAWRRPRRLGAGGPDFRCRSTRATCAAHAVFARVPFPIWWRLIVRIGDPMKVVRRCEAPPSPGQTGGSRHAERIPSHWSISRRRSVRPHRHVWAAIREGDQIERAAGCRQKPSSTTVRRSSRSPTADSRSRQSQNTIVVVTRSTPPHRPPPKSRLSTSESDV